MRCSAQHIKPFTTKEKILSVSINQIRHILVHREQCYNIWARIIPHTHNIVALSQGEPVKLNNCHLKCSNSTAYCVSGKPIHAYITTSRDLIIIILCESSECKRKMVVYVEWCCIFLHWNVIFITKVLMCTLRLVEELT